MKKIVALLLVTAMAATLLAGCGSSTTSKSSDSTTDTVGSNTPDWSAYDSLVSQIKSSTDLTAREALMHKAEDMLMNTGAIVPLYYYNDLYMMKSSLNNLIVNDFGFKFFQYVTGKDALNLNIGPEPAYLDPALNSAVDGACLAVASFVGLYTYDKDGKVTPALAEKTDVSDDKLTYTFHLKTGLKWSDGSALTAKDFAYSWTRFADPATAADYSYLADVFAKTADGKIDVKATDDNTLVAKLSAPCAYFLELMAFPTFMPVPEAAVKAADKDGTNPGKWAQEAGFISNGPYVLKTWKHNESMVYEANPNYYDAANVKVKSLSFMLSADDTAIYSAYNSGNLDFIDTVPTDAIADLIKKNNKEFHVVDQLGTYYAQFNVKSKVFEGKTAEQATAMREAFSYLIDRDYIVTNVAQTGQKPANTFIPEGMSDGNGGVFKANDDAYTYPEKDSVGYYDPTKVDTDKAIELLKSAGYKFDDSGMLDASTPIEITYLTNDSAGNVGIAEAVQQDLAAIGIDVKIDTQEWNVFLENRKSGKYDFARGGWVADYNDPINMLEMFTSDSGNNDPQFGK